MHHIRPRNLFIMLVAALTFMQLSVAASPVRSAPQAASLSIVNLVSGESQVSALDIYVDKTRITKSLKVGNIRGFRMNPGDYDIAIYDEKIRVGKPLLRINDFALKRDDNVTLVVHANEAGELTSSRFTNGTAANEIGLGRLTIRHVAVAPEVDIQIEGETLFINVANRKEVTGSLPAGLHAVRMVLAQGGETLLSDRQVVLNRPMNTIVYLWGSSEDGYRLASHRVRVGAQSSGSLTR
jgi:hypothetical protein